MGLLRTPRTTDVNAGTNPLSAQRKVAPQHDDLDRDASNSIQDDTVVLDATARLIASGEERLADNLQPDVQRYLIDAVQRVRRQELLSFVARQLVISILHRRDETK